MITPKQDAALTALLTYGTVTAAAKQANVGERTLHTWLKEDDFRTELQRRQNEVVDAGYRLLTAGVAGAVATMRAIVDDANAPAATRLRAAEMIVANLLKWREQTDLVERMAAMEAQIASAALQIAVTENSDPIEPAKRIIDYRVKLQAPAGYTDGDTQSTP